MESTTVLIIFANPRSWGHSKTPNLLIAAHRNMHRKVMNIQIGVRAATRQASTQLGAHVQKSRDRAEKLDNFIQPKLPIC